MTAEVSAAKPVPKIQIKVNNKPVTVSGHHVTGLEVKEAAIAFGVEIELNFQLAEVKGKKREIVGDDERVKVEDGTQFIATAPDDNSER
jgi:hypothetical protein